MNEPHYVVTDKILDLRIPSQAKEYRRWLNDPKAAPCNMGLAMQLKDRLRKKKQAENRSQSQ